MAATASTLPPVSRLDIIPSTSVKVAATYCSDSICGTVIARGEPVPGLRTLVLSIGVSDDAALSPWSRILKLLGAVRGRGRLVDLRLHISEPPGKVRKCFNLRLALEVFLTGIPTLRFLSFGSGVNCSMATVSQILRQVVANYRSNLIGLEFVVLDTDPSFDYCRAGFRDWERPAAFSHLRYLAADWVMVEQLMQHSPWIVLPELAYLVVRKATPVAEYDVERQRKLAEFEKLYSGFFPVSFASGISTLALVDGLSLSKQMVFTLVKQFPNVVSVALGVLWKEGSSSLRGDHTHVAQYFLSRLLPLCTELKRLCVRAPVPKDAGVTAGRSWRPDDIAECIAALALARPRRVWVHPNRPDGSSFAHSCEPPLGTDSRYETECYNIYIYISDLANCFILPWQGV